MPASWNLTLDDSSPVFKYFPYGDGAAGDGWATYYSISGFRQAGGDTPLGDSSHLTWNNKSSLSFLFYGKAAYIYGHANCTYNVLFDNTYYHQLPSGQILAGFPSIPIGQHNITITPYANGSMNAFSFDKAVITLESASSNPGQGDVYDNRNSSIAYRGNWTQLTDKSIPSTMAPAPYHETKAGGSTASLSFQGEGVMIKGALNWGHWLYQVTLDGVSSTYNASAWWIIGDAVLYFQGGLDPSEPHTVTLTNEGYDDGMSTIDLNSITVFGSVPNPNLNASTSDSGNSSHSVPTGAIVGAAVGGVLGLLLALGLLVFVYRRQNQDRHMYPDRIARDPNGIDEDKRAGYIAEPFISPPGSSVQAQQPPIGYVVRSTKSGPVVRPTTTLVGHFYSQEQGQPVLSDSNLRSNTSAPSVVPESAQGPQDERTNSHGVALDYGLLAEHIIARLPQPSNGGDPEPSPPEYAPPSPRDRQTRG
ncbi:hypothetical protein FRC08_004464 [Ceratobasidium sp. 394]|nr:hypothetical protein FRC08_004464 [Ceratobasidium sp. 394]